MSEEVGKYGNVDIAYQRFGVTQFHDTFHFGKGTALPDANAEAPDNTYQVKLYVIDSGFDDLDPIQAGIQVNADIDQINVINISDEGTPEAAPSHGSLTSALVGAERGNGFGIVGVCPSAQIFLGDVDNSSGTIFQAAVAAAVDDAVSRNVDIISISLGSPVSTPVMENAIQRAIQAGILVFASAGNGGAPGYEYPAAQTGVISVGSCNLAGAPSSFNTQNEKIALFAPGEDYQLPSNVGQVAVDGTSFSCPFAAGLAALYISRKRQEDANALYRPTRSEIITVLQGENYLNTAGLSYPAPQTNDLASNSEIVFVVGAALAALLIIGFGSLYIMSKNNKRIIIDDIE